MPKKIKDDNDNIKGNGAPSVEELLQTLVASQQELSDRLSDLEEGVHKGDNTLSTVKLANMYMKPENEYLSDCSWISPLAAKPLAEAMTLDEITSPRVRNGETSLNRLLWLNWLHALRGVHGRLLGIVADAMKEQVSAEGVKGEEEMPEFEAGRE